VNPEQLAKARGGDGQAFAELVAPYRRELHVHCYRMLGSAQDAEDALQETLLAAWQGMGSFQERASVRTWLYRIATSRCLNARRSASRRPKAGPPMGLDPPERSGLREVMWLQPYPDQFLEDIPVATGGPEARYEAREAVSLAFITAVQLLPARQRAVLILRDVLGYSAREVGAMLETTEQATASALKRARATLRRQVGPSGHQLPAPAPNSPAEQRLVAEFTPSQWATHLRPLHQRSARADAARQRAYGACPRRRIHQRVDPVRQQCAAHLRAPVEPSQLGSCTGTVPETWIELRVLRPGASELNSMSERCG
jgi:RNA polymerase sigma-70 factor (TIGR02960 family)